MTIELGLCIAFMVAAFPVSKSVAAHYAAFGMANFLMLGVTSADTSALALLFCALLAVDVVLILAGGRKILVVPALASAVLAVESMLNMDYLLNQTSYISAAVNAVIGGTLSREYWKWMNGK
jgi:hypothetical protein